MESHRGRWDRLTLGLAGPLAGRILRFAPNLVPQPGSLMRLSMVRAVGYLDVNAPTVVSRSSQIQVRSDSSAKLRTRFLPH